MEVPALLCYSAAVHNVLFHYSMKNHAEKFFEEMPEKNGGTYDALILGLVKVGWGGWG